ncbi:hypothetical protein [Marinobacterium stanieri]|uniref:Uncharacterized protein n=1 Tax=Marinobacterium stanieri TaxID=49186 RepID=A0A1N6Q3V1_9GAMM|nr:hypothetical protein [Marinobacterium stanieri]SIQ11216.1 hypothetical protein SAMN05421647_102233 [Marinobacterium stanieri]
MEQGRSKDLEALAITERFAEEIDKTGMSISEIARRTDIEHYRIRDVLRHKQRLPTDILARSASIGIDINYVLTGVICSVSHQEKKFIENYRESSEKGRKYDKAFSF